jgi:hypothetical protein
MGLEGSLQWSEETATGSYHEPVESPISYSVSLWTRMGEEECIKDIGGKARRKETTRQTKT